MCSSVKTKHTTLQQRHQSFPATRSYSACAFDIVTSRSVQGRGIGRAAGAGYAALYTAQDNIAHLGGEDQVTDWLSTRCYEKQVDSSGWCKFGPCPPLEEALTSAWCAGTPPRRPPHVQSSTVHAPPAVQGDASPSCCKKKAAAEKVRTPLGLLFPCTACSASSLGSSFGLASSRLSNQ